MNVHHPKLLDKGTSPQTGTRERTETASRVRVEYRPDIDGIRGLAVIAAVIFHSDIGILRGGYVGVELFMVVSGYLITSIIVRDMEQGKFSLRKFLARRIRRLYPALFFMLAVTSVFATLILVPADLYAYGQSVISTTLYGSNFFFWYETDYFAGPAELKVLLHTWSLAVEEQFYIFLPIVMMLTARFLQQRWVAVLSVFAGLSLIACLMIMKSDASAAFYLSPFRAWELLMGSLLGLGVVRCPNSRAWREAVAMGGIFMILFCMFTYSERTVFPGMAAMYPAVGTAMIVAAGTGAATTPLVNRVLGLRPVVFIGVISYSLYLWHWPILVLGRYRAIDHLPLWQTLLLITLAFVAAIASWRYIEVPFRHFRPTAPLRQVFITAGTSMAAACLVGVMLVAGRGLPQRQPVDVVRLSDYANSKSPLWSKCSGGKLLRAPEQCAIGAADNPTAVVWGDSHAAALLGVFDELRKDGIGALSAATSRCPPLLGVAPSPDCMETNSKVMEALRRMDGVRTVILAGRWSIYFQGRAVDLGPAESNEDLPVLTPVRPILMAGKPVTDQAALLEFGLRQTVEELLALGKDVVIVYPVPPIGHDIPSTLARLASKGDDFTQYSVPAGPSLAWDARSYRMLDGLGERPGLHRIYPAKALCSSERCFVYRNDNALYFDSNHLSIPGARLLAPQLKPFLLPASQVSVPASARARPLDAAEGRHDLTRGIRRTDEREG